MKFLPRVTKYLFLGKPFQEAWKNFRRHSMLTFATLILIALLTFLFNVVFSIQLLTNEIFGFLHSRVDISLEVRGDVDRETAQNIAEEMVRLASVRTVTFISNDDALDIVDSDLIPGYREFLSRHNLPNPLPASFHVTLASGNRHDEFRENIRGAPWSSLLVLPDEDREQDLTRTAASELSLFSRTVYTALFVVLGCFVIASLAILVNTIYLSIHAKKLEITIMHLVGAREQYITLPFLYEGLIYGLVASSTGIAAFYILVIFGGWELFPILFSLPAIILQIFFITAICGLASYLMVQRYLRGKLAL